MRHSENERKNINKYKHFFGVNLRQESSQGGEATRRHDGHSSSPPALPNSDNCIPDLVLFNVLSRERKCCVGLVFSFLFPFLFVWFQNFCFCVSVIAKNLDFDELAGDLPFETLGISSWPSDILTGELKLSGLDSPSSLLPPLCLFDTPPIPDPMMER